MVEDRKGGRASERHRAAEKQARLFGRHRRTPVRKSCSRCSWCWPRFVARGFGLYQDALAAKSLDEMAASIESREGFTPIDQLPSLYLQSVVAVRDHRSSPTPASMPSRRAGRS